MHKGHTLSSIICTATHNQQAHVNHKCCLFRVSSFRSQHVDASLLSTKGLSATACWLALSLLALTTSTPSRAYHLHSGCPQSPWSCCSHNVWRWERQRTYPTRSGKTCIFYTILVYPLQYFYIICTSVTPTTACVLRAGNVTVLAKC